MNTHTHSSRIGGRCGAGGFLAIVASLILPAARPLMAETPSLTPVVILRSGGTPILSATQSIGAIESSSPVLLQFAFGFSTDEEVGPGVFLDSLTLTLQEANGSLGVIYNTTDRSGSYWAPPATGFLHLDPASVIRETISFPDLAPAYAHQYAYSVTAPLPAELLGKNLNFYADLFDNQNGIGSLGWMSAITPVPEPATWALLATFLALFFGLSWRKET